jgi:RNA polymerase sigma factor (sigma-70 family)
LKRKDFKILSFIQAGEDDKAIECLYKSEFGKITSLVKRGGGNEEDAKDIFQETVIIFYRQLKLGKYNEAHEIGGYIYTIARNLWINHARKQKLHSSLENMTEKISDEEDLNYESLSEEREKTVKYLFSHLGDMCRQLLTLYYYHKLSLSEIASRLGYKSEVVVKSKKYKCKQFLVEKVKTRANLNND